MLDNFRKTAFILCVCGILISIWFSFSIGLKLLISGVVALMSMDMYNDFWGE